MDRPATRLRLGRLTVSVSERVTPTERLRRYAELAVRVGANVQPGQDVVVTCFVEHADVAREVARESYRAGAQHVVVLYNDLHLRKAAVELGPESEIGWSAPYLLDWIKRWSTEHPALIALTGNPTPTLMSDLDPTLVGRSDPPEIRAAFLEQIHERSVNWTIVAAPNIGWATEVFGEPDMERLWDAVSVSTRLDEPDPVGAWRAHNEMLQVRADALNEHGFDAIRYRGPGTELTVGLIPGSRWRCATFATAAGIPHVPNLPTEEVFTSPDWRRAEGHVRSTYPLVAAGTKVTGLEFRLEGGKIVDVEAESGADIIRVQLETDDQAPYLGELALVDGTSPVKRTGLVFSDTLFDENATCHIAFGAGFPEALGRDVPADELLDAGVNMSAIHTDFMVGSEDVDVDGLDAGGAATAIIRANAWQL